MYIFAAVLTLLLSCSSLAAAVAGGQCICLLILLI